jgi:pimeloyl-ACP methyl ester carboxylesterase
MSTGAQVAELGDGRTLTYETFGEQAAEPLLLVMGLGGPMIWWNDEFCAQLADRGFHVIRFDNRDAGHSFRGEGQVRTRDIVSAFLGRPVKRPYGLEDLAADAFDLLDHLEIDTVHLVGMSMGGMIVQTMAITHPERVRSLTSIMSTTGQRTVGWQDPRILPTLLKPSKGAEGYVRNGFELWQKIQSPDFPLSEDEINARSRRTWDYGVSAAGTGRQMLAILTQADRTQALKQLNIPTLVIHGLADRMVHVSGGRATSMAVPRSELLVIKGMGHDLPEPLWPTYLAAIRRTADRALKSAS